MAEMTFREGNQVKWIGSRPGHKGTQVVKHHSVVGPGNQIIYTVPAGKTLYLVSAFCSYRSSAEAEGNAILLVNTAVPAIHWWIMLFITQLIESGSDTRCFNPPVEIPPLYTIEVNSTLATIATIGSIFGWVE